MPLITLTTDFGVGDDETGVLKGVIWRICPTAQIADLSHGVTPQNILEGALLLGRTAFYFPNGTIHVGIIDPGVGTFRRGIAARLGPHFFVGPDNGLFTQLLEKAERESFIIEIIHLDQPQYWLSHITSVFHGRDIFAPVAAALANGIPLQQLGTPINDPIRLSIPQPKPVKGGWHGEVLYIDAFGNLGTNIPAHLLSGRVGYQVIIAGQQIDGLIQTFGERPAGSLVALIDSSDTLSISLVNGSAADFLDARPGDVFEIMELP